MKKHDFETKTNEWLESHLGFKSGLVGDFYHFTSHESAKAIVDSKTFRASFIRSTSDPLEFALPLSICRDWMVDGAGLFKFPNYPGAIFKHFNEIAVEPHLRPYFISTSGVDNEDLKKLYGDTAVKLSCDGKQQLFSVQCRYISDPKKEITALLDDWISFTKIKNSNFSGQSGTQYLMKNFHTFMQVFYIISLSTKSAAFHYEKETRFVLLKTTPDDTCELHAARTSVCLAPQFQHKEYLPVHLEACGVKTSLHI
jgi:hypothetical protein